MGAKNDPRKLKRVISLCLDACKHPSTGIGKPEPLRYDYQGYWSRRIDHEHRLVYAFDSDDLTVIQCRYHYR
ncbi:MAG: Txe/YoeB family addiction module toxin [Gammaproteobacteria bacterium]